MPMTFDDLHKLVVGRERAMVEFKESLTEEVIRGLSTDIAALANSQGGSIVFGVTDDGDPKGCDVPADAHDRMSDEAKNCRPAIAIDFEDIPFGTRNFLVVKVPKSTVVHSDVNRRFPIRIGNKTDYLDALGLVALIQERRLIQEGGLSQPPPPQQLVRKAVSDEEANSIVLAMTNRDAAVRAEGLRDIAAMSWRFFVLDRKPIADLVKEVLSSDSSEEIKLVLEAVRSAVVWGNDVEKTSVIGWMGRVSEISKSMPPEIAAKAFEILNLARRQEAVDVLVHWVRTADDATFSQLRPQNALVNARHYGLYEPYKKAMYAILTKETNEDAKKRASTVLESLRQAYG